MKRLITKNGLTLTELLVASFLMGIIMVGTAGFSVAIKRMQDTTDKQAILAMHTAAAMAHIERNLQMTHGALSDNAYVEDLSNPNSSWSFKTDPNLTPDDATDDVWAIIFSPNNGANRFNLYACFQPVGSGPGLGPDPDMGQTPCGQNRIWLLDTKLETFTLNWVVDNSPSVLDAHVDVSISTLFDASTAFHVLNNPRYTMTTRIPLPSHSQN